MPESASLYGLGERTTTTGIKLRRDGIPLALWNRDHQAALPDQNVYGSHPILMDVREGEPPDVTRLGCRALLVSVPLPPSARPERARQPTHPHGRARG